MKVSEDIQLFLDDHILTTQQLSFSPFKGVYEDAIDEWLKNLKITRDVIALWAEVQK